MHFEVEQKFRVAGLETVLSVCDAQGILFGAAVRQVDHYFNHPARDFAVTDEAFRIRQVGERNFVTYKGPKIDPATKTRHELELELPAGEEAADAYRKLFELLGFRFVASVAKTRRTARIKHEGLSFEAALDDVDGLGLFVELETSADESGLERAQAALVSLARQLGLQGVERRSYLELLLAVSVPPGRRG